MPTLIVISPNLKVREYRLDVAVTLGRHESNIIQLCEEKASRCHCRIEPDKGRFQIVDLKSSNGVFVNGAKVRSKLLEHNDKITIGATTLIFCDAESFQAGAGTRDLVEAVSTAALAVIPDSAIPAPPEDPVQARRPRARRYFKRRASQALTYAFGAGLAAVAIACVYLTPKPGTRTHDDERKETTQVREPEQRAIVAAFPPQAVRVEPHVPERSSVLPELTLAERFETMHAAHQRALSSGNLLGAKAALQSFLAVVPEGSDASAQVQLAREELTQTLRLIEVSNATSLQQAREALAKNNFSIVAQRCSLVLALDPDGALGKEAREMLEQIDQRTAPLAEETRRKVFAALKQGQLEIARTAIEGPLGKLAGTRWGGDLSALQLCMLIASGFLEEVERARVIAAASGHPLPARIASKKLDCVLAGVRGMNLELECGQARMRLNLAALTPADLEATWIALGFSQRYAELGCLWYLLERREAARTYSELALKTFSDRREHGKAPLATLLSSLISDSRNLHIYDFNTWQQQTDWEAISGSWLTENERYVLQSAYGGETRLRPEKIGGAFPLAHARLSFECEIVRSAPGWTFLCELGDEKQGVSIQLEAQLLTVQDKASGTKVSAALGEKSTFHVDLSIDGSAATVAVDGGPPLKLEAPAEFQSRGTLSFQAQQCSCALDDIILRSAE